MGTDAGPDALLSQPDSRATAMTANTHIFMASLSAPSYTVDGYSLILRQTLEWFYKVVAVSLVVIAVSIAWAVFQPKEQGCPLAHPALAG